MKRKKSICYVSPSVILHDLFSRRSTWFILISLISVPFMIGSFLSHSLRQKSLRNTVESMQLTADRQRDYAVDSLNAISLLMENNTSNIHFIDVGRSESKDNPVHAGLASQALRTNAEPYSKIDSAYLVCNVNHTIYTSIDQTAFSSDTFYDLSWRFQYHASERGIQLLDSVRNIHAPHHHEDLYISMISRVPYFSTLQHKWLIYNISIDSLASALLTETENDNLTSQNALWIYNRNGELIWRQQYNDAPSTYEELQENTRSEFSSAALLYPQGSNYLTVTSEDPVYGWRYVQVLPYTEVLKNASAINHLIWYGILGMIIIALLCWFYASYTHHAHELQAAEVIKTKTGIANSENEAPLSYLSRIAEESQSHATVNERILQNYSNVLNEHVILSLIHGESKDEAKADEQRLLMEKLGILQETVPQNYVVSLARIESISAFKADMQQDLYEQLKKILQYGCDERMLADYQACYAWEDSSLLAAVFSFPKTLDSRQVQNDLSTMGAAIQKQLTLLSEQPSVIAFGSVTDSPWTLHESYENAKQLLQYKIYYSKDVPYTYTAKIEIDMEMSYDHQKKLVDFIKLGKLKEASDLLESYFTILHSNPYLHLDRARDIGAQLIETIHIALLGKEKYADDHVNDVKGLQSEIMKIDFIHDIADYVVSYAKTVTEIMCEQQHNKKDIRVQDVLAWIDSNYNQDISLDDIAERMGLSTTYASKQIKAYTGTNVVNYINNVRIEHAKELLQNTTMSSNEIGTHVGFRYSQSFIRSFNKIVGMTPGDYRKLYKQNNTARNETSFTVMDDGSDSSGNP